MNIVSTIILTSSDDSEALYKNKCKIPVMLFSNNTVHVQLRLKNFKRKVTQAHYIHVH